jgi:hypothetical protein
LGRFGEIWGDLGATLKFRSFYPMGMDPSDKFYLFPVDRIYTGFMWDLGMPKPRIKRKYKFW